MSKLIGSTFGAGLVSAGCNTGVSFTLGGTDEDIQVDGVALREAQGVHADAVRAVVAAHDPLAELPPAQSPFDALVEKLRSNPAAVAAIEAAFKL